MPWKECSVVEERLRFVARLLDGEAMTELCREFGISRKTGYKIFDRYKEHGLEVHLICDAVQVFDYVSFSPNRDYRFVDAVAVLPESNARAWAPRCRREGIPAVGLFTNGNVATAKPAAAMKVASLE